MTRSLPSPATSWLIEELAAAGLTVSATKIERLQGSGLAPRPLHHRSKVLTGSHLWPEGAVEHYLAVVPLVRQRHHATELAAVTMLGYGYPIGGVLVRTAYAEVLPSIQDRVGWCDAMVEHYHQHGMQLAAAAVELLRSQGNEGTANDLALTFFDGLSAFARGSAGREQIRAFLASVLPNFKQAPEELAEFIIDLYARLQKEVSLPRLLETATTATVEELLSVRPLAEQEIDECLARFGPLNVTCGSCDEWRGLLTGAMLPYHLRIQQLDLEELWPDSMIPESLQGPSPLAHLEALQDQ